MQPTTTSAPTPMQGTWQVNYTTINNATCILLKMAAVINVTYTNVSNKTQEGQISVPVNANSTGSCVDFKDKEESIELVWSSNPNFTDTLKFTFNKTNDKFDLKAINIQLTLDPEVFPSAKGKNIYLNYM